MTGVAVPSAAASFSAGEFGGELVAAIRAIEADKTLSDAEKAKRRQALLGGKAAVEEEGGSGDDFKCAICIQLLDRPVSTPCGHNFCLKYFQKWTGQGQKTCACSRKQIPFDIRSQPRINSILVFAIRLAKTDKSTRSSVEAASKVYYSIKNQNRPEKAFVTERAKKAGKANACREDYGIAGQSGYGAQSVVLSGGYVYDEDHGEWFLYTGSGGRHLSGNKRTNKEQSFDQEFDKMNEALRVSQRKVFFICSCCGRCVLRWKELRCVGVRVEYRTITFVRCDNEPAPWTRPLPVIEKLENAVDITRRKGDPSWDYDDEESRWMWKKPPPASKKKVNSGDGGGKRTRKRKLQGTVKRQLPKEDLSWETDTESPEECNEMSHLVQMTADYLQNPQVNRELAGAIESLQRRAAAEIEKSETSGQGDESDEQTDTVADTEVSNGDCQGVEETEVEERASKKAKVEV
ncbi:hypothetical protein Tsubulata_041474 [Turnera subulata]|uniref:RING-type domain-containing protein n=1 Tax=Turnera subulata TaxID=218843 RepID=A0A9Q0JA00_9ROSI|nr:hypothetical protein Tsubulata_041474 [Turnera subulata]